MVQRVDVEAHVDGPGARGVDAIQSSREALPDADAVHDLHGERGDVEVLDHLPLWRVHIPYADEGDPIGIEAEEGETIFVFGCRNLEFLPQEIYSIIIICPTCTA